MHKQAIAPIPRGRTDDASRNLRTDGLRSLVFLDVPMGRQSLASECNKSVGLGIQFLRGEEIHTFIAGPRLQSPSGAIAARRSSKGSGKRNNSEHRPDQACRLILIGTVLDLP